MPIYVCKSKKLTIHYIASTIKEAHLKARHSFGEGVSFSVREATPAEIEQLKAESYGQIWHMSRQPQPASFRR